MTKTLGSWRDRPIGSDWHEAGKYWSPRRWAGLRVLFSVCFSEHVIF